jgi:two-component system sensor histidine kinase PilS (NtrC family)
MDRFINEFRELKGATETDIELKIESPLAKVAMDPEQLHQVMWNLLENAWHYSEPSQSAPRVSVRLAEAEGEIVLDVSDNGPGVSREVQAHLFEPFHSQRQGGTGLGLYLARELCQANGARLSFLPDELQSSRFRISFPGEWQEYLA